jgi:hypothetical protein
MLDQYRNVQNIKDAHAAAGMYFFSASTMRFFASRIHSTRATYDGAGGWLLVESQKRCFEDYARVSRVVRFDETTKSVDAVRNDAGDALEFDNPAAARAWIAKAHPNA